MPPESSALRFDPDSPFFGSQQKDLVLIGPSLDGGLEEYKIGRVFDRDGFFEGIIYELNTSVCDRSQEVVKEALLRGASKLYADSTTKDAA